MFEKNRTTLPFVMNPNHGRHPAGAVIQSMIKEIIDNFAMSGVSFY